MPIPLEYKNASRAFEDFLIDARDALSLATTHQTYTTVQAVLTVFRRRLRPKEVVLFAQELPAVLRAILIAEWDPDTLPVAFADRRTMTREAQAYRGDHNLATDDCIPVVAAALRRHLDAASFDSMLSRLPAEAVSFWTP